MVKKSKNQTPAEITELPVSFGGVSIGQTTARLGLSINKDRLNIIAAEELLCGRRLTGMVQLGGAGDSPGQTTMWETDVVVDGTFDVHRFGVGSDHYTTGLTFKLAEIDIADLAKFSKGDGRLVVNQVADIPEPSADDDDADDNDQRRIPGSLTADGPWRDVSLDDLFSGAILKSFKGGGLATVGDLHDYQQPDRNGFTKQLTDLKGIGASKVTQIEERMIQFWEDNPQEEE